MTPHDPTAEPASCPGCADPRAPAFDHDAVKARRPKDFEKQVRDHVAEIARLPPHPDPPVELPAPAYRFCGIQLHQDAPRRARRWLLAHPIR